jgi:hypothetical protein
MHVSKAQKLDLSCMHALGEQVIHGVLVLQADIARHQPVLESMTASPSRGPLSVLNR